MSSLFDVVKTNIQIAGKPCLFVDLVLNQSFNAHHRFRIEVNYEALGQKWMSSPREIVLLVGEELTISMISLNKSSSYYFRGLITNVSIAGQAGIRQRVVLTGGGQTVRMDGKKAMDSFTDKTLEQIVTEATANSGNGATITTDPTFKDVIEYICQYNESDFEFLNRLSYLYGEWFWDTGTEVRFGRGTYSPGEAVQMVYDQSLIDFELSANLVPARSNRYAYLLHQDKEVETFASDDVPDVWGYQKMILKKSDSVYTAESYLPVDIPTRNIHNLYDMVELERSRAAARMLTVKGSSRTCEVQLGKVIRVMMPQSVPFRNVDDFLVTEIEHHVNEVGYYMNRFTGIISDMPAIPMVTIDPPRTGPQQGTVLSNADPKGKGHVKVQLQWQKGIGKSTNWVRVQTPDAGSSGKVSSNRGFVCIPEEGDTVMVGFDYGDPNRPYVMGSLFSEMAGSGGGQGNKGKSITTRSGHTLMFDDSADGLGITLKDSNGNILHLDAKGQNIDITAPETINLNAKQINLTAQDISLNASNSINVISQPKEKGGEGTIDITAHKTMSLVTETEGFSVDSQSKDISLKAKTELSAISQSSSATIQSATDVAIEGADIQITGSSTVRVSSSDTDIV